MAVGLLLATMIVLCPAASVAEADPFLGTWVLNLARSRSSTPGQTEEQTATYEAVGDGVKISVKMRTADGNATRSRTR